MTPFDRFVEAFHRHFIRHPNRRAQLGIDSELDVLPDPSLGDLHGRVREAEALLAWLDQIPRPGELTTQQKLDLELAELQLRAEVHRDSYAFNGRLEKQQLPNAGEEIGDGLFTMFLVDPRPAGERLSDITSRIEQIGEYLQAMIDRLDTPVARWASVDRECITELPGFFGVLDVWAEEVNWPDRGRLHRARESAQTAISRYVARLDSLETTDQFHIGDDHARELVRLAGIDLSFEEMHVTATDFLERTSAIIEETRNRLVAKYALPRETSAAALHEHLNRRFRVEVAGDDFTPILARYEAERARVLEFIHQQNLFPILEDQDMKIIRTPEFMVPLIPAGAMTGPAAFREGTRVSQIFLTLTQDRLDDHTELGIPMMMVHEGIPGHHLHLATARTHESVIRRHVSASDQAEGWATMLEDYMLDLGYMEELKDEALFSGKRDISRIAARVAIDLFFMTGDRKYLQLGVECDTALQDPFRAAANLLKAVTGFSEARAQAELNWYSTERGIPLTYLIGNTLVWGLKHQVTNYGAQRNPPLSGLDLDREFHRVFLDAGLMPVRFMTRIFQQEGLLPASAG